jgi:DNA-binding transcriptional regulator YiaG
MVRNKKNEELINLFRRVLTAPDIDGRKQLFSIDPEDIQAVKLPLTPHCDLSVEQIVGMQLMLYSDLTQAKIARLLNLHRSTITKWKNERDDFRKAYWMMKIVMEVDESETSVGGAVV